MFPTGLHPNLRCSPIVGIKAGVRQPVDIEEIYYRPIVYFLDIKQYNESTNLHGVYHVTIPNRFTSGLLYTNVFIAYFRKSMKILRMYCV